MFGIGLPELLLILGLGLIVLGPDKLPELAKSLAKGMLELKKTAEALKENMQEELREGEKDLLNAPNEKIEQVWRGLDGKGAAPSDLLPEEFGTLEANSAPSVEGGTPTRGLDQEPAAPADAAPAAEQAPAAEKTAQAETDVAPPAPEAKTDDAENVAGR